METYNERWSDPVECVLGHAVGHQEDEGVDDGGAVDCGHDGEPHTKFGGIFLNMVGENLLDDATEYELDQLDDPHRSFDKFKRQTRADSADSEAQ